jgi:uncharacterized Zn-finger protein
MNCTKKFSRSDELTRHYKIHIKKADSGVNVLNKPKQVKTSSKTSTASSSSPQYLYSPPLSSPTWESSPAFSLELPALVYPKNPASVLPSIRYLLNFPSNQDSMLNY